MPDRSRVMAQTKRDILDLQVGIWAWDKEPHLRKKILLWRSLIMDAGWITVVKDQGKVISYDFHFVTCVM